MTTLGSFQPTFATNRPGATERVVDAINTLLGGMRQHLVQVPGVSIASAYFNPGGFGLLADELEQFGPVRLLLGAEPGQDRPTVRPLGTRTGRRGEQQRMRRAMEGHLRRLSQDRDLLGFTMEADAQARRLVSWLRAGNVEVRRYEAGFLHGKAFIVEGPYAGVIAGSSNFTYAGLALNKELNLGQYQPETVVAVREWFEEAWAASAPFDLAAIYESRFEPHRPWDVFLRMLHELYGVDVAAEQSDPRRSNLGLTDFQADGVWRAQRILDHLQGVIIADEVGLGKTYIAGELLHEAVILNRQKALVVAPATLRDSTWKPFLRETNLPADIVSYEELTRGMPAAGQQGAALQDPDAYALVIVDEAHALRSLGTQRAEAMRLLLTGKVPKRLVLLTATPVNNSLYDLYNLISYFVTNDATFADSGVPSLKAYFDRAMRMNPDDLSPEHLFDVLDKVAVRRTRRFVRHHYVGDTVRIRGVERQIAFPTPRVRRVDYNLDEALPGMFDRLATALGAHLPDDEGEPHAVYLDDPGKVLTLARYVPSRFRLGDATEEQYEQQNAGLLRSALLKRFESSAYAFGRTVDKMIESHKFFLHALDQGKVMTGEALREWAVSDTDDIDEFLESLSEEAADRVADATLYDVAALTAAVEADLALLAAFHQDVAAHATEPGADVPYQAGIDPKIDVLVEQLATIAAEAAAQGIGEQNTRDRRKVLIFSYYSDTVTLVHDRLTAAIATDARLAAYRGRVATAAGPDRVGRASVITGFAPRTAGTGVEPDLYDLIVATDVLAEGVNLQQARHIINYDLPWNPMRLVQRHGRIDRIGSEHAEVFLRCFFPDEQLERLLGLEERLQRKLKQAAAATGVGEVLPGFKGYEVNLTEGRDEIDSLRHEDATLFESGGASSLSGEEYRRRLRKAMASPTFADAVLGLPWGSGTGFIRTQAAGGGAVGSSGGSAGGTQPGLIFCARIGDHPRPWFRYVPLTAALDVQRDQNGNVEIVDDTLSCLSAADPLDEATPVDLPEPLRQAVFGAWEHARRHIYEAWTRNTDPANYQVNIPKPMREAAALVRRHGTHLDHQDDLVDRLEAPYSPRIQTEIRKVLISDAHPKARVDRLSELADQLGLTKQPAPEPLPQIEESDIHLTCWIATT
ncbi:helicase-related protein [Parafrankia discariae]|uniref:helicase-related protein n=1 Tax=Parafrankia discariae TaxID=365528 RepID=UPI0003A3F0AF|nr:helicase-related protein [Parafrankia discariae]